MAACQSMRANTILTEKLWEFQFKLHCGSVISMPYPVNRKVFVIVPVNQSRAKDTAATLKS